MENTRYEIFQRLHPEKAVFLVRDIETNEFFVRKIYKYHKGMVYERLLNHKFEGIPKIYQFEMLDDNYCTVLEEYVNGVNLDKYIKEHGAFSAQEATSLGIQLCDLIDRFHQLEPPLIHRDIKPSNIIMAEDGKIWLIDFNAAKEFHDEKTSDTYYIGTKDFAAPEQFGFGLSDARTDIFGLGKTLQYFVNGCKSKELPKGLPANLRKAITKSTQQDPARRFKSISLMRKQLTSNSKPLALWISVAVLLSALIPFAAMNIFDKPTYIDVVDKTGVDTDIESRLPAKDISNLDNSPINESAEQADTDNLTKPVTSAVVSSDTTATGLTITPTTAPSAATKFPLQLTQNVTSIAPAANHGFVLEIPIKNFGNNPDLMGMDVEYTDNQICTLMKIPSRESNTVTFLVLPTKQYSGSLDLNLYRCNTNVSSRDASDVIKCSVQVNFRITCNHEWIPATCRHPAYCKQCGLYQGTAYPIKVNNDICVHCGNNHDTTVVESITCEDITKTIYPAIFPEFNSDIRNGYVNFTINYAPNSTLNSGVDYGYIFDQEDNEVYYVSSTPTSCTFAVPIYQKRQSYMIKFGSSIYYTFQHKSY